MKILILISQLFLWGCVITVTETETIYEHQDPTGWWVTVDATDGYVFYEYSCLDYNGDYHYFGYEYDESQTLVAVYWDKGYWHANHSSLSLHITHSDYVEDYVFGVSEFWYDDMYLESLGHHQISFTGDYDIQGNTLNLDTGAGYVTMRRGDVPEEIEYLCHE